MHAPASSPASGGGSTGRARGSRPSRPAATRPAPARPTARHARPARPGALESLVGALGEFVRRQPDEVWGWLLLLVGVLAALGVHFDLLGLAGRELRRVGAAGLGWGEDVVPAALVLGAVSLILGRARRGVAGIAVAVAVLAVASSTLADLAGGHPSWHRPVAVLGGAGGLLGGLTGGGLRSLLGAAGASILLAACAAGAGCALAGVAMRAALAGLGRGMLACGRTAAGLLERRPAAEPAVATVRPLFAADPQPSPGAVMLGAFDDDLAELSEEPAPGPAAVETLPGPERAARVQDGSSTPPGEQAETAGEVPPGAGEQLSLGILPPGTPWKLPAQRLLKRSKAQDLDRAAIEERGRVLERALAAHGVETHLVGYTVGPTVTRFELELGAGVKVARVTSLNRDIAYAMASADVRILAPIPGRSAIGVEVPNHDRQLVTLGDVLASPEARRAVHPLEVALGRDIAGRAVMVNLAEMPHLLIAGATGAGKSSCINSLVTSILMRSTPEQVRLILVDPKRVELGQYNGLPHLLTPVVVQPKRAANALSWAVAEMERRYDLLAEAGMRDITGYNAAVDRGDFLEPPLVPPAPADEAPPAGPVEAAEDVLAEPPGTAEETGEDGDDSPGEPEGSGEPAAHSRYQRLPFVLVVVDELNDLMMVAARDVEESICRIAQMARAVGIHLVIATQRPSVDVITGVIKANIPSRLAFSVSSLADSRVILDQPGAERLVGRGDLLLLTASSSVARRLQGPWVSEDEVRAVVASWRRQSAPRYLDGVVGEEEGGGGVTGGEDDDDELLQQALELVVRSQLGSTSMLQRKLRVGFARAGRLMDLLERRGVVGPSEGSKARAVLMTPDELDEGRR